jgi:hypothetical protein
MDKIQNSMTDKNCPQISTTQQPLNIPSNMADIFSMFFLGMLFGWKEPPDLSKFKPKLENAIQGSENAEADIAELATSLNLPAEKVQEAINTIKKYKQ